MSDQYPSRVAEKIVVRCPDGLRNRLAERAKANGRSANAEAVMALEAWVEQSPRRTAAEERMMASLSPEDREWLSAEMNRILGRR